VKRRFPSPWTVEETAPCFIVRDANKQALAFVYCEDEPGRRGAPPSYSPATRLGALPLDIAKLPALVGSVRRGYIAGVPRCPVVNCQAAAPF
jgi:hypothetical protein